MKILSTWFDIILSDRKTRCFCEIIISSKQDLRRNRSGLGGDEDVLYSNKHIAICKDCREHCYVLHKRNRSKVILSDHTRANRRSEQFRPPFFCFGGLLWYDNCKIFVNIPPWVAFNNWTALWNCPCLRQSMGFSKFWPIFVENFVSLVISSKIEKRVCHLKWLGKCCFFGGYGA